MSVQTKSGKEVKAHTRYFNKAGQRVCGVTTFLGVLNKPALVPWANKLGLEGVEVRAYVDDKADIGKLAHRMVLDHNRKEETDISIYTPKQVELAKICFSKYLNWEKKYKIKPILLETPLVSEKYQYGGTPDNYCLLDGVYTLLDYKTGKGIYEEMYYQLAAYVQLIREIGHIVDKAKILRLGRDETEGFDESPEIYDFSNYFKVFEHCIKIYNLRKVICIK